MQSTTFVNSNNKMSIICHLVFILTFTNQANPLYISFVSVQRRLSPAHLCASDLWHSFVNSKPLRDLLPNPIYVFHGRTSPIPILYVSSQLRLSEAFLLARPASSVMRG